MKKLTLFGIILVIVGIGLSAGQRPPTISYREGIAGERFSRDNRQQESQSSESSEENLVSNRVLDLSQKLLGKILDRSSNKFEVISPVSISAELHLAFLGANGLTFDEIKQFLGYESSGFRKHKK
jgi:hypothetical protein